MDVLELKKNLRKRLLPVKSHVKIFHPWELTKLKFENHLEVRFPVEVYQVMKVGNVWMVRVLERGSISEEEVFSDEHEACMYFIEIINKIL